MDDPNKRNDCGHLGTWPSISDVDTFLSRFNHDNNYDDGSTKLHLGDTIRIIDGTINDIWVIAGFDCEHNRKANDGTVYDNGYGIMLWPIWAVNDANKGYWNEENTTVGGYISSLAHTNSNKLAVTMKDSILGTHLINRNVLLSDSINSYGFANNYTWTTAYGAAPTIGQLRGIFNFNQTIYDEGEANYRLPLFNYQSYEVSYDFWFRNICDKSDNNYQVFYNHGYSATNYSMRYYHTLLYIR